MTRVLHISDTHFGSERASVVEALLRFTQEQAPTLVILSGDVTQRATAREFERARAFVDRLAVPCLCVPGNHDIPLFNLWLRTTAPYARFERSFGGDRSPTFESAELQVTCLDTTRWWRHKNGELSADQIDAVERRLARSRATQLRIVVTHQPVCVTRPDDRGNLLRGREPAVRRWVAAGADLLLGGHIHLPFVTPVSEHFPGLDRRAFVVQAGTAVSSRVRHDAGNSVNLIHRLPGDGKTKVARVERWDHSEGAGRFVSVASTEMRWEL